MKKYEKLFVYGTLREQSVQKKVIGRAVEGFSDTLEGYKKSKISIKGNTYPIIYHYPNSSVKGLVLHVAHKELKLIDKYETNKYKRKKVVLKSGKTAWAYQK